MASHNGTHPDLENGAPAPFILLTGLGEKDIYVYGEDDIPPGMAPQYQEQILQQLATMRQDLLSLAPEQVERLRARRDEHDRFLSSSGERMPTPADFMRYASAFLQRIGTMSATYDPQQAPVLQLRQLERTMQIFNALAAFADRIGFQHQFDETGQLTHLIIPEKDAVLQRYAEQHTPRFGMTPNSEKEETHMRAFVQLGTLIQILETYVNEIRGIALQSGGFYREELDNIKGYLEVFHQDISEAIRSGQIPRYQSSLNEALGYMHSDPSRIILFQNDGPGMNDMMRMWELMKSREQGTIGGQPASAPAPETAPMTAGGEAGTTETKDMLLRIISETQAEMHVGGAQPARR